MPIDYSKYPADWKTNIVPRILKRACNCCEFCGLANGQKVYSVALKVNDAGRYKIKRIWLSDWSDMIRISAFKTAEPAKVVNVVLTIAHLDHDETNHDAPDNRLAALCQYCHLNYDAEEKYRRAIAKSENKSMQVVP